MSTDDTDPKSGKACTKCKTWKSFDAYEWRAERNNYRSRCRICRNYKRPSGAQNYKKRLALGRVSQAEAEKRKAREVDRAIKRSQRKYTERRAFLNEYKLSRGCADCSYNVHPAALDFDHLPGYEKTLRFAQATRRSWESVLLELEKCEVVCANCHRIRTVERRRSQKAQV